MRSLFLLFLFIINVNVYAAEKGSEFPVLDKDATWEDYKIEMEKYFSEMESVKGRGFKPFKRYEWLMEQRMDENGNLPNMNQVYQEFLDYKKANKKKYDALKLQAGTEWELIGPVEKAETRAGLGRLNVVEIDPNDAEIIWAGAATGGVWKSTDGGGSWETFPFTEFASIGIGAIGIAPSRPQTVYVGTGDRSAGLGGGAGQYYNYYSVGVVRTTNGGNTWNLVSPIGGMQQSNSAYVTGILVHPNDDDIVYVSVYDDNPNSGNDGGLYLSTNGGLSWDKILSYSIWDIEFKPNDPNIIHHVVVTGRTSKVIRTIDISKMEVINDHQVNGALRTEITVSDDKPEYVMAIHAATNSGLLGIDKSIDGGKSWTRIQDTSPNYLSLENNGAGQGGQGFYDLCIEMDPSNANLVYIGGINVYRSTNGGSSFSQCTWSYQQIGGVSYVHPDIHGFGFGRDGKSYVVHDGGINYSNNDGNSWIDITNGISNTQYYRFGQSSTDDNVFIAGSQDNSTWVNDNGTWRIAFGGDGFHCLVDPNNDLIMYGSSNLSSYTGWIWKSTNRFRTPQGSLIFGPVNVNGNTASGEQPMWVAPFEIDPNNSSVLYAGHRNVWKTTNAGTSWNKVTNINATIRALEVSPISSNHVWAAVGNRLYGTTDGGSSWDLLFTAPGGNISDIEGSNDEANKCYIAVLGFSSGNKVFEVTGNNGQNITSSGLPNLGTVSIVEHSLSGDLFVGMDAGVYRRSSGKNNWEPYSNGLPQVIISELMIHEGTQRLRAATYGRGIWEVEIKDCNMDQPNVLVSGETVICPGETINLQLEGFFDDWTWSNGAKSRSITVDAPGEYWVDVTDGKGCFARSQVIYVTQPDIEEPEIATTDDLTAVCENDSLKLSVNGFYDDYVWSDGQTGRSIWVKDPGEYYVTVTDDGCEITSDPIEIISSDSPNTPSISAIDITLRAPFADAYQWYKDNQKLSGQTKQTFTPIEDGTYFVEVYNEAGCSSISEGYQVTWFSIEDSQFAGMSISPNPSNGVINIIAETGELNQVAITVFDIQGNEILNLGPIVVDGTLQKRIELNDAIPGVYFIQLNSGRDQITSKIIIE